MYKLSGGRGGKQKRCGALRDQRDGQPCLLLSTTAKRRAPHQSADIPDFPNFGPWKVVRARAEDRAVRVLQVQGRQGKEPHLPCVATAFAATNTAFALCSNWLHGYRHCLCPVFLLPSWLMRQCLRLVCLCVSLSSRARTLPWPCVSIASVARTAPWPCVFTAFIMAKPPPLPCAAKTMFAEFDEDHSGFLDMG